MKSIIIRYKGILNTEELESLEKELSEKLCANVTIVDERFGEITII